MLMQLMAASAEACLHDEEVWVELSFSLLADLLHMGTPLFRQTLKGVETINWWGVAFTVHLSVVCRRIDCVASEDSKLHPCACISTTADSQLVWCMHNHLRTVRPDPAAAVQAYLRN